MSVKLLSPETIGNAVHHTATGIIDRLRPSETEGVLNKDTLAAYVLSEALVEQQVALDTMQDYPVEVVRRVPHGKPRKTPFGTIVQERVRFSDGAVRLNSLGMPDERVIGSENVCPNVVSAGDALFTGPDGLNKRFIEGLIERGFYVQWLHHQGRHAVLPTSRERWHTMWKFLSNKDIGKSADHDHALLDNLAPNAPFDTNNVLRRGYSRSGMSGEAYRAKAAGYKRNVIFDDLTASCFAHGADLSELFSTFREQAPKELLGLKRVAGKVIKRALDDMDPTIIFDYLGTFDVHPMNVIHELAWIKPLVNGDAGYYAKAVPLDAVGVRTQMSDDLMSHQAEWEQIHANRPGIHFLYRDGAHIDPADPDIMDEELDRFARLNIYRQEHNDDLSKLALADIVPKPKLLAA